MEEFEEFIAKAEETGLKVQPYSNTKLLNITDINGIIQSYYTTTGTAIFRDSNSKYNSNRHTEKNMPFDYFLDLCKGEKNIFDTFF